MHAKNNQKLTNHILEHFMPSHVGRTSARSSLQERIQLNPFVAAAIGVVYNGLILIFLMLVSENLTHESNRSWLEVFSPLLASLAIVALCNIIKMVQVVKIVGRYVLRPVATTVLYDTIDSITGFLIGVLIACWLDRMFEASLTVVLLPLWVSVCIGVFLRVFDARDPVMQPQRRSLYLKLICYFLYRGFGPCMVCTRIDQLQTSSWGIAFSPWWLLISGLGITGICFLVSLPVFVTRLSPFRHVMIRNAAGRRRRQWQRIWAIHLVVNTATLLLISTTTFVFLVKLAYKLDGIKPDLTIKSIMTPLYFLHGVSLLLDPISSLYRQSWSKVQRQLLMIRSIRHHRASVALNDATQQKELVLSPASVVLIQLSPNAFTKAEDSALETNNVTVTDFTEIEPDDDSCCYICMGNPSQAVILECGHSGLCFDCACQLIRKPDAQCPLCRQPISLVLQLASRIVVNELTLYHATSCATAGPV
eukprot:c3373_g1_i1.p1 GENE.c3373_g1_i1~~c3373_g1_i1.p1  ORF type:complete len:477 (+),score=90.38 c3373_g1_i1:147-1577(+)